MIVMQVYAGKYTKRREGGERMGRLKQATRIEEKKRYGEKTGEGGKRGSKKEKVNGGKRG